MKKVIGNHVTRPDWGHSDDSQKRGWAQSSRRNGIVANSRPLAIVALAWIAITLTGPASAQNWTEFRGPNGTGISLGATFPVRLDQETINWQVPIRGKAWSSPVIWDKQVWLTTADEDGATMSAICIDLETGKTRFDLLLHQNENPDFVHPTNSYASSTPVVEAGRVYVHFGKYGTSCLDTNTGKVIWQRTDLKCDHFRGPGSSPILFRDLLIVAFDGADRQYVVGLSRNTGETVWQTDRDINYGTTNGDFKKAYGTGAVLEVDGDPLLIYPSAVATIAYRPLTGEQVWKVYHGGMNVSARPLQTPDGTVLISNGMGKMIAVDPNGFGDITESNIRWRLAKGVARMPTPLLIGNRMYMVNDSGIVSCYDVTNGQTLWQSRMGGTFSSSPVFDGHAIFAASEEGDVYAIAPGDEFRLLGKTSLEDGFKATPALAGRFMVLRSFATLICVQGTVAESQTEHPLSDPRRGLWP